MDIVLQFCDTYFLDQVYAAVLPKTWHIGCNGLLCQNAMDSISKSNFSDQKTWQSFIIDAPPCGQTLYPSASRFLALTPTEYAHMSLVDRDNIYRQFLSLYLITLIFGFVLYFSTATLCYIFLYDKTAFQHPKFRKHQIWSEIQESLWSIPFMALMTIPIFLLDVGGYSKLYEVEGPGVWYEIIQFPLFVMVTDAMNYWIHRMLHHPFLYKTLHKQHHKWIIATPFSGYAFHPIDGFAQSLPYHIFIFILPLNKWQYLPIWVICNVWSVLIHEGQYVSDSKIMNSPACHTVHHLRFSYNYGQFLTLWDRIGGTYRNPYEELGRDLDSSQKKSEKVETIDCDDKQQRGQCVGLSVKKSQ